MAQFLYHLHVVLNTFLYSLCLYIVAKLREEIYLLNEVILYHPYASLGLFLGCNKQVGRIYLITLKLGYTLHGDSIHFFY